MIKLPSHKCSHLISFKGYLPNIAKAPPLHRCKLSFNPTCSFPPPQPLQLLIPYSYTPRTRPVLPTHTVKYACVLASEWPIFPITNTSDTTGQQVRAHAASGQCRLHFLCCPLTLIIHTTAVAPSSLPLLSRCPTHQLPQCPSLPRTSPQSPMLAHLTCHMHLQYTMSCCHPFTAIRFQSCCHLLKATQVQCCRPCPQSTKSSSRQPKAIQVQFANTSSKPPKSSLTLAAC